MTFSKRPSRCSGRLGGRCTSTSSPSAPSRPAPALAPGPRPGSDHADPARAGAEEGRAHARSCKRAGHLRAEELRAHQGAEARGQVAPSRAATDPEGKRRRRRRPRKDTALPEAGTPEEALAAEALDSIPEAPATDAGTVTDTDTATVTVTDTTTDTATATDTVTAPSSEPPIVDLDALGPVSPRRYPRVVDLPTEEALAAEYADEIAGGSVGPPAAEEVVDAQSADEDRPLLAEIKDERDHRGRNRRRERRGKDKAVKKEARPQQPAQSQSQSQPQSQSRPGGHERSERHERHERHERPERRERHERHERHEQSAHPGPAPMPPPTPTPTKTPAPTQTAPQAHSHPQPQAHLPPQPIPIPIPSAGASVADIAVSLLRSLNDPRPVHARQLAAMAAKRKLLAGDPEDLWRTVRAALIADARERHAAGMRPRARAQGGGLFALATGKLDETVRGAEEALAARLEDLARATRDGLRAALARLSMGAIEQLARLYLERVDVRDVERVKRTGETTYLGGSRRDGKKILVGVRTGGGEVGRYSVGELRAGVEAKACAEGILIAAGRLGPEGARELAAPGPPISALVGDELADVLIRVGVAVQRAAIPVAYLDINLLAELGE